MGQSISIISIFQNKLVATQEMSSEAKLRDYDAELRSATLTTLECGATPMYRDGRPYHSYGRR